VLGRGGREARPTEAGVLRLLALTGRTESSVCGGILPGRPPGRPHRQDVSGPLSNGERDWTGKGHFDSRPQAMAAMIKNERQYRITKAQADKFTQALRELRREGKRTTHPVLHKAQRDALRSQLADLSCELTAYEGLRSGKQRGLALTSLADLPKTLIRGRITAGLSQEALAHKLGVTAASSAGQSHGVSSRESRTCPRSRSRAWSHAPASHGEDR
jgi:hypothetical protein